MTWTDEELVAKTIGGDADSFNELIHRWERPIYALAYRTIGREEDARDVCQETFLRAFRALPGFRGQAKFSSWLYRIALNLCRDWIRRERRRRKSGQAIKVWLVGETRNGLQSCGQWPIVWVTSYRGLRRPEVWESCASALYIVVWIGGRGASKSC